MNIRIFNKISDISPSQWNLLVRNNNPFLKHEFLDALETHGCVGHRSGWLPCHIAIYENEQLKAAMPLYKKFNSSGEFVFDYAWADAYTRYGLDYYPKLVSAIPYTPAIGQRFLCQIDDEPEYIPLLLNASLSFAEKSGASSLHFLFPDKKTHQTLENHGLISRYDCQFFWHNPGYQSFDDFLLKLTSRKRKNIKQERYKVQRAGITFRILNGYTATSTDWQNFTRFYEKTHVEKLNTPKFNLGFFTEIANSLAEHTVLVMADHEERCVAAALMYRSDTHLYGRHWGAIQQFDALHFEACYYQGIEYCIREKLQCFDPGVQGEHKIARGFIPTRTESNHWISDPRLAGPIASYCKREELAVDNYMNELKCSNPYREDEST